MNSYFIDVNSFHNEIVDDYNKNYYRKTYSSKMPMQVFTFARNCILAVNTVYTQWAGGC